MSYFRPMGDDGPITSPSQVDGVRSPPIWNPGGESVVVAEVPAKRVECSALPADSPWRRPGQVCADTSDGLFDMIGGALKKIGDAVVSGVSALPAPTTGAAAPTDPPWALIVAGGGLAAYLLLRKKRKAA